MFGKRNVVIVRIEANITWQMAYDEQSSMWVGACPALNLNALGETWIELQENASEALGLLLQDLFIENELEAFLRTRGWRPITEIPPPGSNPSFDVPFKVEREEIAKLLASA